MAADSGPNDALMTDATPPRDVPRPRRRAMTRWLRVAVPALGAILLTIVILWPVFREQEPGFTLSFTEATEFDDRLRMKGLRFEGTDSKNRPFVVTAETAFRQATNADSVQMNAVTANVTLKNDWWLNLEAEEGVFRDQSEELRLSGMVDLFSSRGYEIHGRNILVDLRAGRASSIDRITGQGPLGTFEAGGFESDLATENVVLTEPVRMTIFPQAGRTEG